MFHTLLRAASRLQCMCCAPRMQGSRGRSSTSATWAGAKVALAHHTNLIAKQQQRGRRHHLHIRVFWRGRHKMSVAPALVSLSMIVLQVDFWTKAETECQPTSFNSVTVGDLLPGVIPQQAVRLSSWQL